MVQLNDELVALLDAEAARRGVSRSAVIRDAIASHLAQEREDTVDRKILEGYGRIPPGTPDEWGEPGEIADTSARELSQRLDDEERRQGWEPW